VGILPRFSDRGRSLGGQAPEAVEARTRVFGGRSVSDLDARGKSESRPLVREWRARAWPRTGIDPEREEEVFAPEIGGVAGNTGLWFRPPRADACAEPTQPTFPQGRSQLPAKKQPDQDQTYAEQPEKCHAELVAFLFVRRRSDRCGACGSPGRTPACAAWKPRTS